MMNSSTVNMMQAGDASLVSERLTGNRKAFGQIVARSQSLICALAYSNMGSTVFFRTANLSPNIAAG